MRRELVLAGLAVAVGCGPKLMWSGHTPDRQHRVEVIEEGGKSYVVIDGARRAAYRGIDGWSLAFANQHLAFPARVGGQWVVVHDGRWGQRWDGVAELRLTDHGRVAYAGQRRGGWHMVVDDVAGPRFDAILAGTLHLTPSGHVAYVAERGGRLHGVIDGQIGRGFDGIGSLVVSQDGAHAAYAGRIGLDVFAVVDGVVGARWSAISSFTFGPAARLAYAAFDGASWHVVTDGVVGPAVDRVRQIVFRADGAHVAWVGRVASVDVLALDDVPISTWPAGRADKLAFRPDVPAAGVGLAYVAPGELGGERMVVDGRAGPTYDEVRAPVWSGNGRLAYAARRDRTWVLIVDDIELDRADRISDPVFSRDGRRIAYAIKRGKVASVVVDGKAQQFDLLFEDTLTFSASGQQWGVIAGDLAREQLFIAINARPRVWLAPVEIYSAAAARTPDVLRGWVQAEADRATR